MELLILNQPRVFPRQRAYQSVKRFFDVILCLLLLPAALPLFIICALAILFDSTGPIFFIQERIGKGGRPFRILKFRTMIVDLDDRQGRAFMKAYVRGDIGANEDGKQTFKPIKPQEITRIGRILRKTSLDELPQIINVMKGEMSIVGPRPNVVWEVDAYQPWHYERLEVLSGITGLAQISGRSSISFNSLVRNDIAYIEKQSLSLDLKILWWTFTTVLLGKGAK